jgi:hypothetical protein
MLPKHLRATVVLLTVYGLFWVQWSVVRAQNFGGIDEWMILSLVSRGIAAVPHANRPLGLLFNLPAGLFPAHLLEASYLVHAHYLALAGLLTSLLLLRCAPGRPEWALLAGVLAATWAPSDWLRLNSIYSAAYAGAAASTLVAVGLLAASRPRPLLAFLAGAVGFLTTRVHEGPLPLLLLAPLLLALFGVRVSRTGLTLYALLMLLAVATVAVPLLFARQETLYQREVLGVYLDVPGLGARLVEQFRLHLAPLFSWGAGMLGPRALASAAIVFGAALLVGSTGAPPQEWRPVVRGAAAGLLGAAAAYAPFLMGARMTARGGRTEMISGPWIAILVAALILLAAGALPARARLPALAGLAALVAASGAAHTTQLQQSWDRSAVYPHQSRTMTELVSLAPDLKPGSLLIFVDPGRTWLGTFVFHYAVDLLYAGAAAGCVSNGREELFLTCYMDPAGVHQDPWPMLRVPWQLAPRTYAFEEVVVVRPGAEGRVEIADSWPAELPPLPAGAAYAPRSRVIPLAKRIAARTVLGPGSP